MGLSGAFRVIPGNMVEYTFPLYMDPRLAVNHTQWLRKYLGASLHTFPQFHRVLDPPSNGGVVTRIFGKDD